jgi:hypothetical protein
MKSTEISELMMLSIVRVAISNESFTGVIMCNLLMANSI